MPDTEQQTTKIQQRTVEPAQFIHTLAVVTVRLIDDLPGGMEGWGADVLAVASRFVQSLLPKIKEADSPNSKSINVGTNMRTIAQNIKSRTRPALAMSDSPAGNIPISTRIWGQMATQNDRFQERYRTATRLGWALTVLRSAGDRFCINYEGDAGDRIVELLKDNRVHGVMYPWLAKNSKKLRLSLSLNWLELLQLAENDNVKSLNKCYEEIQTFEPSVVGTVLVAALGEITKFTAQVYVDESQHEIISAQRREGELIQRRMRASEKRKARAEKIGAIGNERLRKGKENLDDTNQTRSSAIPGFLKALFGTTDHVLTMQTAEAEIKELSEALKFMPEHTNGMVELYKGLLGSVAQMNETLRQIDLILMTGDIAEVGKRARILAGNINQVRSAVRATMERMQPQESLETNQENLINQLSGENQ